MVRAKFKVWKKEVTLDGETINLSPVTSGSPENKEFYKYTPSGSIILQTINPAAANAFALGKEYYVDFTEA